MHICDSTTMHASKGLLAIPKIPIFNLNGGIGGSANASVNPCTSVNVHVDASIKCFENYRSPVPKPNDIETLRYKEREASMLREQATLLQLEHERLKCINQQLARHCCDLFQRFQPQQCHNGVEKAEELQQFLKNENAELKRQLLQNTNQIEKLTFKLEQQQRQQQQQCKTEDDKPLLSNVPNFNSKCFWDQRNENSHELMDLDFDNLCNTSIFPSGIGGDDICDYGDHYGEKNIDLLFDMET
ncbi:hypothetical protein RFI_38984 [Reticulomyxa filosa]|uniref:Uncharacterized protein n=1 Tax=Reticulomyxa filosa TaxID=46433 RepID=X6LAF2_RETFI|nr:hypothetical protein RFI_38984 [Reticulomyxa filosa]|eukprot:ETN98508.1 hypothetical protein RFI_38984 [Reticulomyxa filosa]